MSGGGVMLSGWLRKSPPENKLKSRHHSWKKRWFVLKSGRLYGDPNVLEYSKYQTSKKPIKSINLNECSQIDVNVNIPVRADKKDPSEHFIFSIVTNSRTFYLIADSIREMSTWVQCLCDLCGFNHDSNDKGDLGREKQTFRAAQPSSLNVNGAATASSYSLLPTAADGGPTPAPRPERTLTTASKPIEPNSVTSGQNGAVNSSFNYLSQNGYDSPEEDSNFKNNRGFTGASKCNRADFFHQRLPPVDLPVLPPPTEPDSSSYLHLADCETIGSDPDSAFLTVEKTDQRRVSTDSVFTHGDGSDESKDGESPIPALNVPPKSRFVDPLRLDSMPSVPPPPPPTDVPPHSKFDDDDDDDVVDARPRKLTLSRPNRLPPIDDTGLYNVLPGQQRDHHTSVDPVRWQGSNSSSSYGSSDGRYTNKHLSPPEYINTPDGKSPGSFSGAAHFSASSFSSPGPVSLSPANHGHQVYDVPSPLSPVFPMSTSPRSNYQTPQPLERAIASKIVLGNVNQPMSKSEASTRNQLKGVKMLDVSALQITAADPSPTCPTNQDAGTSRSSEISSGLNSDSTYSVLPSRPPKPVGARGPQPQMQNPAFESVYASPRNHSASSVGSAEHSTYDTVKRQSPISPPHTTVIGSIPDHKNQNTLTPMSNLSRNAISATNSPLATPDLSRRIDINKTASFNSKISPLVRQNKAVSGSAPSLYDVPQALVKSSVYPRQETRSSQSSSTSGDGSMLSSSARNSAGDTSIYDLPRKSSAQHQDVLNKVDDFAHPNYEKMAPQTEFNTQIQEDTNAYITMEGTMSTPNINSLMSHVPPVQTLHSRIIDARQSHDVPPPVHRDLKPGRKSLGSDGGSSQSGIDRKKNSRDSFESDEAVSPPHTTVLHTIPIVTEPKPFQYGSSPMGSRSSSITSPQHTRLNRGDDLSSRLSPVPPRPPKSSFSSLSPRSPPLGTPSGQLPGRPYTPTHGSQKERHTNNQSFSNVPERPPKPANMRFNTISSLGWDESRMPPKRPPKPSDDHSVAPLRLPKSSTTPSSGDSIFSGGMPPTFFPVGTSLYTPSALVPPPPADVAEKEIKYVEISTQSKNQDQTHIDNVDRNALHVQYIEIDPGKTRALERMKEERQKSLQQRANSDAHSVGKGKE